MSRRQNNEVYHSRQNLECVTVDSSTVWSETLQMQFLVHSNCLRLEKHKEYIELKGYRLDEAVQKNLHYPRLKSDGLYPSMCALCWRWLECITPYDGCLQRIRGSSFNNKRYAKNGNKPPPPSAGQAQPTPQC